VAFLSRVDSLRGVERFARANPHLLPHLGLRKPPGHTILTLLLHRLDPEKLQEALLQVFPGADLGEVLVVDGKHLRGSGKGKSPQVRLVEVLALHLLTTLAQAKAEGLKGKVVPKGGRTSLSRRGTRGNCWRGPWRGSRAWRRGGFPARPRRCGTWCGMGRCGPTDLADPLRV